MKKKIWIGLGAFVIAGGNMTGAGLPKSAQAAKSAQSLGKHQLMSSAANIILAQSQGGEGEGGEGGEGGEAGINVAATENDPVEYNVALQVIAAHYYAGLAAYEAKHVEEGAQMFAHGLAEVYVAMEEVFKKRGIEDLGKKLEAAVEAGTEKKPAKVVTGARQRCAGRLSEGGESRAEVQRNAAGGEGKGDGEYAAPCVGAVSGCTQGQGQPRILSRRAWALRSRLRKMPRKSCPGCARPTRKRRRPLKLPSSFPRRRIRASKAPAKSMQANSSPRPRQRSLHSRVFRPPRISADLKPLPICWAGAFRFAATGFLKDKGSSFAGQPGPTRRITRGRAE